MYKNPPAFSRGIYFLSDLYYDYIHVFAVFFPTTRSSIAGDFAKTR